jgi:hypothetical protein
MTTSDSGQETEFPHGIGRVARRELALNGYTRFEQLTKTTPRELLAIHGVGKKAMRILGAELTSRGLSFADEPDHSLRDTMAS